MRTYSIILLISVSLVACKKDEDNNPESDLIGTWKLTEVLNDPGDGSGTYQAVESSKTMTFFNDNTLTSNGSLCNNSTNSDNQTSGIYSLIDSTYTSDDCSNSAFDFSFRLENGELTIAYPCIEPCGAKFTKE